MSPADGQNSVTQSRGFATQSGVTHVKLLNMTNHGDGTYLGLGEVRFDTEPVPEPTTFLLAAFGLLGFTWLGRRRRR